VTVEDGVELPEGAPVIVSLKRWQAERDRLLARGTPLGVKLPNNTSPDTIKEDLQHFSLVALDFPIFRDGRSFSWARLLRQRFGFKGEIRATGNVLRDQIFFMSRVGIDAFEVPEGFPLEAFARAMRDFSHAYQPSIDGRRTVMDLRHSQRIAAE
jgi:uncharacterized protein (DUF934 family)